MQKKNDAHVEIFYRAPPPITVYDLYNYIIFDIRLYIAALYISSWVKKVVASNIVEMYCRDACYE